MKRLIAVCACIAGALLTSPHAARAAEFEMGAAMEISGVMRSDLDLDADTYTQGDDDAFWYHDVTIAMTGRITETASVYMSLSLLDRNWGDPGTSGAQAVMFDDDVAYATFAIAPVTVTAGRMMDDFGVGFKYLGNPVDRFRVDYAASEMVGVGIFTDKLDDGAFSGNVGDADRYGVIAETSVGDVKMGAQYIHTNDRYNDLTGGEADVYATGAQGGIGYFLEAVYQAGSLYENCGVGIACKPMGGVIGVSMDMAPMSVGVAFAYATDNFAADDEFAPTLFFGTDQDTAIMDFMALPDESIMALVLNADYAVSDALSAGARVAYADGVASISGPTVTGSVVEADVYAEYTVVDGITWSVGAGYLVPSDITVADDPAMVAIHTISIEL